MYMYKQFLMLRVKLAELDNEKKLKTNVHLALLKH